MKKLLSCLIFVLTMSLFGCGSSDEQGIKDSREGFMVKFQKELIENNIPFKTDDEGYIRYSSEYKEAVEKIKNQIDKKISSEVGSKFEDEISTKYFRKLLDENGISYRTENRKDGEWTYWHPTNKDQVKEIEMKVVVHAFQQRKK
ncbi:MAG: hypothetical protein L3K25_10885 [Gammaproteobacteria bacterium]|nr:hypothetical protein [Gammaproteobacteria bacterium]